MNIGLRMPYAGALARPDNLLRFAARADDLGFYSLFMSDHIVIPRRIDSAYPYNESGFDEPEDSLELLTTLAFVAAATRKIRMMTGILVLPYRNPLLTAKMLANIDYLSGGRLIVGAGVGWMREEFEALGAEFEKRGTLADAYIKAFRIAWSNALSPKPIQKPSPPIWIGGESPSAMRRAAELGEGWMPIGANAKYPLRDSSELQLSMEKVKQHMARAGRNVSQFQFGYMVPRYKLLKGSDALPVKRAPFVGNAEEIIEDITSFGDIGVSFLGFEILGRDIEEATQGIERFGEEIVDRL